MKCFRILCLTGVLFLIGYQAIGQEEIDLVTLENKIIEVRIVSGNNNDSLSITTENSEISILGDWKYEKLKTVFKPLIPLTAGKEFLVYRNAVNTDSFILSKKKQVPPSVLAFFPSSDTIPENLLKCYLSFSQPMRDINIYDFIVVNDEKGQEIKDVILPLQPALWNKEQTILTLWIDPGRIKRDLIRNKNLGIPLKKGNNYSIMVSQEWQAKNGEKLSYDFRKFFYVSKRDESIPNTSQWVVTSPKQGGTKSLTIEFPESMDYRTTLEGFKIYKGDQEIKGKTSLRYHETKWVFIPEQPWLMGNYQIKIDF